MRQSMERFTGRVENYTKFRRGYPPEIIGFLEESTGLRKRFRIADIGAGTGLFTELLLKYGYRVKAVEPNDEMRSEAEARLSRFEAFSSINGTAENTGIESGRIDLIVAAQAFHWFKMPETKQEFARILKPGGHVVLLWNIMQADTEFLEEYHALKINYGKDYKEIEHTTPEAITTFFEPLQVKKQVFEHSLLLNMESLKGLLLSSSYMPQEHEGGYTDMMEELERLFERYHVNGSVEMKYEAKVYTGI